jgi:hypothetical protein
MAQSLNSNQLSTVGFGENATVVNFMVQLDWTMGTDCPLQTTAQIFGPMLFWVSWEGVSR